MESVGVVEVLLNKLHMGLGVSEFGVSSTPASEVGVQAKERVTTLDVCCRFVGGLEDTDSPDDEPSPSGSSNSLSSLLAGSLKK